MASGKSWSEFSVGTSIDNVDSMLFLDVSAPESQKNKTIIATDFYNAVANGIGKTNLATGYTFSGGTISKTLTVSGDCEVNQDLTSTSSVEFNRVTVNNTDASNTCLSLENDDTSASINFLYSTSGRNYPFKMFGNSSLYLNLIGFRGGDQEVEFEFDGNSNGGVVFYNGFDGSDVTIQIQGYLKDHNGLNVARFDYGGDALIGLPDVGSKVSGASMRNGQIHPYIDEASDVLHFQTKDSVGTIQDYSIDLAGPPVTSVFTRTGAVTAQSGDYNTDQVTEGTNQYFTNSRALTAVGKTNLATGYTFSGGTISKTLTVSGDCEVDQGVTTTSSPTFSGATISNRIDLNNTGTMGANTGISFFSTNDDYRIGFDDKGSTVGYLRYNVDTADSVHGHEFTAGIVGGASTSLMLLRGDGLLRVGSHTPESRIDSGADIRVAEIATPTTPTSGIKIYAKSDNNLYRLNDAGQEVQIDAVAVTDKLTLDHNNSPGTPASGKGTIFIKTDKDVWQIDDAGNERNLAFDQEDGIVSTAITYQATATDTVIKVDASGGGVTIQLDAAILGRHPITIVRMDVSASTISVSGINGTSIRGGVGTIPSGQYNSLTFVKLSSNEMLQTHAGP